jgi:hypothetical protein
MLIPEMNGHIDDEIPDSSKRHKAQDLFIFTKISAVIFLINSY